MPEASAAGLAIMKAHPIVLGVCAVVAIGVIAYQLFKPNKEKKMTYSSDRSTRHYESSYYYNPDSKTITDSAAPMSDTSENNLRKRQVAGKVSCTTKSNISKAPIDKKSNSTVDSSVQTEPVPVDNNRNIDKKMLPEKNLGIPMSVEEKVNEYFRRNISETDSTQNNLSEKFTNGKQVQCCDNCECELHSTEDDTSDTCSSSWSNVSLKKSPDDKAYLDKMCTTLNKELDDINKTVASTSRSVVSIETETSIGTLFSGDSELCRGCEQNPVNTYTEPCNHRYMCSDCAMRIFRLFKRCKVCRAKIERIVVAE